MVDIYLHSATRFNSMVLNSLNTGIILPFYFTTLFRMVLLVKACSYDLRTIRGTQFSVHYYLDILPQQLHSNATHILMSLQKSYKL
jgi:hypothetical protein